MAVVTVENVIQEIAPDDSMYLGDRSHYFMVGRVALKWIDVALLVAGKESVSSILDLPCGHGRVLRALKAAFPEAKLTACDIDRPGVDFCAETFGAIPIYSDVDPRAVKLEQGAYDLIWCGSLFTHFDASRWGPFLEMFRSALAPGGILVFTNHGRYRAEILREGLGSTGLTEDQGKAILADYDRAGFGYQDYPPKDELPRLQSGLDSDYGMSLARPSWVCEQIEAVDLGLVLYREAVWPLDGGQQDVIACVRDLYVGPQIVPVEAVERLCERLPERDAAIVQALAYGDRKPQQIAQEFGLSATGEWWGWFETVLQPAAAECGIELNLPYDLRHTGVQVLAERGASASEIATALGMDEQEVRLAYWHLLS